ncbi:hypothetical protein L1987_56105 [Smallanthus sonchifolius]|uniref:Uncharacterized protein n=1 Tax=Smallanthus sonchifolius TaxID=185202 RepID=A0ACB9EBY7_9ASTR|nr:hypothetical protein L1987_56105 [Smallanthus sonchifolius]
MWIFSFGALIDLLSPFLWTSITFISNSLTRLFLIIGFNPSPHRNTNKKTQNFSREGEFVSRREAGCPATGGNTAFL